MPNFTDILSMAPSAAERPKPLPPGTYHCIVKEPPTNRTATTGTEILSYVLHPTAATEDVSETDLQAMGGIGNRTLKVDFFLTEAAAYRLREFLEDLGLDSADYDSLAEMVNDSINREVLAVVRHQAPRAKPGQPQSDDPVIYANVVDTARVA